MAQVSKATGLTFVYDGPTAVIHDVNYGDTSPIPPVTIAFAHANEAPTFFPDPTDTNTLAVGGSFFYGSSGSEFYGAGFFSSTPQNYAAWLLGDDTLVTGSDFHNAGYDAIYLSNVVRPGSAIDRNINPTQNPFFVPGTPTGTLLPPPATFHETSFWAHGVQFGLEVRY